MADSANSGSEEEQHVLRVHFLDGSFREVEINDDTNFGEVHERLAEQLRAPDKVSPRDPLLHEFALFKHIGDPVQVHYILPEYLVFPVVESFEELDKICFQRLIFPTPLHEGASDMDPYTLAQSNESKHKTPRTSSSAAITPPATDTESSGASPRSGLSSSAQILPSELGTSLGLSFESSLLSSVARDTSSGLDSSRGSNALTSPTPTSPDQSSDRKSPRSRSRSLSSVPNLRFSSIVKLSPRNSPRVESPRFSSFKFQIPMDPILRWLEYCECLHIFQTQLLYKPMLKEVFEIGALDLLIKSKRENVSTKTLLKLRLPEFVPERYVAASKSSTAMDQLMNILTDIKLLSADAAMQELIQLVYKWRFFGSVLFFDCKPSDKRISTKPVVIAINEDGILVLKKDGDVLHIYPISTILSWSAGFTSFQFESGPDPHNPHMYSDAPQCVSVETSQGETIGRVLSAIVDRKTRMVFDIIRLMAPPELHPDSAPTSPRGGLVHSASK